MITGEMLHEAFNTTQPPYVPKLAWSELSEPARARYAGMAYCLLREMREGQAAWTDLQNTPSYAEKEVRHFQGQAQGIPPIYACITDECFHIVDVPGTLCAFCETKIGV